ncbi:hypothetical protein DLJ59_27755 [Micromonospora inaquosa]|uniref:AAA+ ATPase domain-containing protein n=1 Tax=Micromonospora inaquosa TaxID=2203716 RepID=A0A3N9WBA7_9ACTN|nr:hypothetical protein DLJ59_27755 [Micromonospora inaquosa]
MSGTRRTRQKGSGVAKGDGGGVGNERGAAHRRGLAVLLAARGLASFPLTLHDGSKFTPNRLQFESDQPTDDVICTATSGARMYVSAKRKCGDDDQNVGKTVRQWVAQAVSLRGGDVLALATSRLNGVMEHIRDALKRHHQYPDAASPVDEAAALRALSTRIAAATTDPTLQTQVLNAAFVLVNESVEAGDEGFEFAAALLEGGVVGVGEGFAAAQALSAAFGIQASKAAASSLSDWVQILRAAKLTFHADRRGPAGAAEHARQLAIEGYRDRLAGQLGRVDLALLAEDVPPLTVAGLPAGLRVAINTKAGDVDNIESLLAIARRWPRLLLTGLPGMGKSTALRQLAAQWMTASGTPTPILVPLLEVAAQCRTANDVTLSVLCQVAAASAPAGQYEDLGAELEAECQRGQAVLLLDAFDECPNQAVLADGLQAVLNALPAQVGVILATRDSGQRALGRLGLPIAELEPARNLEQVLDQLLAHVAAARQIEPAQRSGWLADRHRWLRAVRREHRDVGRVPLLATLMTMEMADATSAPAAQGQARLLHSAIKHSIERWERHRPQSLGADPAQLLDGYAVLGTLLTDKGSASRADADQALSAMLGQRWGIGAPGLARVSIDHILRFWDQHVGVYVAGRDGRITPRSRVFAEIGAAMAVDWLTDDELTAWIDTMLTSRNRRAAVLFAGELDPRVLPLLLANGTVHRGARAIAAAELVERGALLDDTQQRMLMELLDTAAASAMESSGHENPQNWTYVLKLAALKLPALLRKQRRQSLGSLCTAEPVRIVAAALTALADAAADHRELSPAEVAAVRTALTVYSPDGMPAAVRTTGSYKVLLPGNLHIARSSVDHLSVLGDDMVPYICGVARLGRLGTYSDIAAVLRGRGYHPRLSPREHNANLITQMFGGPLEHGTHVLPLLQAARDISPPPLAEISVHDRWRLPELCTLVGLIGVTTADAGGYLAARTEPADVLIGWLTAVANAAGLDRGAVAAQAQAAIDEQQRREDPSVFDILTVPTGEHLPAIDSRRLTSADRQALLTALNAESTWIAESAARILTTDAHLASQLHQQLQHVGPQRREHLVKFIRAHTDRLAPLPADQGDRLEPIEVSVANLM